MASGDQLNSSSGDLVDLEGWWLSQCLRTSIFIIWIEWSDSTGLWRRIWKFRI